MIEAAFVERFAGKGGVVNIPVGACLTLVEPDPSPTVGPALDIRLTLIVISGTTEGDGNSFLMRRTEREITPFSREAAMNSLGSANLSSAVNALRIPSASTAPSQSRPMGTAAIGVKANYGNSDLASAQADTRSNATRIILGLAAAEQVYGAD